MTDLKNYLRKNNFRKNKWQHTIIALIVSQSLFLIPQPGLAETDYIKIAGQPVFAISASAGVVSVANRTQTVQDCLDNALVAAKDHSPSSVNITYVKGTPVITLGGYQVVTVDISDAKAANTTPALLANQWAEKIRKALADQQSINTYIAQLTGDYAASAPPINTNQNNNTAPNMIQQQAQSSPNAYSQKAARQTRNFSQTANTPASGQSNYPNSNQPFNAGREQDLPYDSYNTNPYTAHQNNNPGYQSNYEQYQGSNRDGQNSDQPGSPQGYRQGRIAYAQVGQIIPVTLSTSISTQVARAGDVIQATISQNVNIGYSIIPAGSIVMGQVADAKAGGHLTKSGELQIKFNRLRLADGSETPITAHIVGGIGKYAEVGGDQSDQFKGETTGNKIGSVAFRGLLGAGGGAALGTAVGAIAGGGYGAGMGAWSGAAIGGGLGAADSLILRKGKDVTVPSGTKLQLQLDSPVAISGVIPANY